MFMHCDVGINYIDVGWSKLLLPNNMLLRNWMQVHDVETVMHVMLLVQNMGGGKAGLADRKGGAVGHSKYMCPICKTAAPSLTSMQVGTPLRVMMLAPGSSPLQ